MRALRVPNYVQTQAMPNHGIAHDIDEILERIEQGESMRQIANDLGVNVSTVSRWLDADEQRSARAMRRSAEAWLDRGLGAIEQAMNRSSGIDPTAARAYAQECARRAAIRNPHYREQQSVQHVGADGGAIRVDVIERRVVRPTDAIDVTPRAIGGGSMDGGGHG